MTEDHVSSLCSVIEQYLNLAGLLDLFAITSSAFQSQLMVDLPITFCTAQLQARPVPLFYLSDYNSELGRIA
jgi:hypothetical protein